MKNFDLISEQSQDVDECKVIKRIYGSDNGDNRVIVFETIVTQPDGDLKVDMSPIVLPSTVKDQKQDKLFKILIILFFVVVFVLEILILSFI
ncbi:MAG: hypothetical protein CL843_09240 [Crocinitomicaceae bacterium]|nr:hypothetical protein [Crocinitomicaceae bacterium]|tara:strand:+ start:1024 stop:1299 length:276 start_codon:yes stop_codon:yes gene_type:complete